MSVRFLTLAVGILAGGVIVACSGTEPTGPRMQESARPSFAVSSGCLADTQAPTITYLTATPSVLSPADKQMVTVTVSSGAIDNCGPPMCSISVTSSEKGKGGAPDIVVPSGSTLSLRAEKGNVYTITLTCRDAAGNSTSASTTVTVSATTSKCGKDDQGKGDDKNGDVDVQNKCKNSEGENDDRNG